MKSRKSMAWVLILALTVTCFAGCGKQGGSKELTNRGERASNNELVVAIGEEPETGFDSTTGSHGSITKIFFSTLFKRDKQLGWTNDLATGYQVSPDKLTWTITLREDAFFTDDTQVKAEDVVYTYQTAKDSGSDIDLTMIDHIKAINDTTVEFTLTRPYSTFIERLAYLGIVPKHAYDENFKDNPIGSGPYAFVEWSKGQQVIAAANENYYGEVPNIKKLTLVFLNSDTAFEAVKNGTVDVAAINGTLAGQQVEGAKVVDIASIECYGVCFPVIPNEGKIAEDGTEMGNNVTSDISIRRALNAAVDREKIVSGVLNGYGSVSTTGLEKMPWLNTDAVLDPSEYGDIGAAKKILTDGGWADSDNDGIVEKNGQKAKFKLLYTDGIYRQEMALEFVNVANQIGIQVDLEKTTWDTILPDIHKEAVLYGFGSGDPSELFNLYYGGCAGGPVAWDNSGCYDNPKVNECIDKALSATDEAEAIPYWKELQQYTSAKADAPYCWLANANHVYLAADGFSFGEPVVQPHGGRIFDNVSEWSWEK
ncbi:ABC transporter substrate-binding protein [Clostridium aminobutyricum]|uniref:ABC transporter substrate-binding protein n=1 Tax=Clostridium aminobutyricum TaxID=33953 RepID=A0A939IJ08_CLOAM|nr:ABC transporter substrate-binding protein [Clostridium aminobutyricum]MBN7773621.1 ABC transporter substrate-binding protein [Clostridium aminobutyricum]